MIYITNIWVLSLVVIVWAINTWLFLAGLLLILRYLPAARDSPIHLGLQQCVDPVVLAVRCRIEQWWGKAVHPFVPWGVCILGALVVRNVLIQILLASSQ